MAWDCPKVRLLTDCDGSRYDRIINGLENTGAQTGMDQKEGWDIHKLNQQMIEMLKIDCKATSEKINTSSFARWTEEHKKFVNILGKTMEFVSNTAVLLYCSAASAASRKVLSTGGQKLAQYGDDFGKMGIYVENPKIKVDWTQYAKHGTKRLQERGMTEEMVNRIVENGKVLSQNNGNKFVYITKEGAVVVSKGGRLVTAWSRSDFDTAMLEIIKKSFGE